MKKRQAKKLRKKYEAAAIRYGLHIRKMIREGDGRLAAMIEVVPVSEPGPSADSVR